MPEFYENQAFGRDDGAVVRIDFVSNDEVFFRSWSSVQTKARMVRMTIDLFRQALSGEGMVQYSPDDVLVKEARKGEG